MSVRRWLYRNVYLKTSHWNKIRRMVRERDGYKCQVAKCKNTFPLDVHHTTYRIGIIPILFLERLFLSRLITLCRDHHNQVHRGRGFKLRNGRKLKAFRYD